MDSVFDKYNIITIFIVNVFFVVYTNSRYSVQTSIVLAGKISQKSNKIII